MKKTEIEKLKKNLEWLKTEPTGTVMSYLPIYDGKNHWAIVFGWVDGYGEPEDSRICGKVAYQPSNSMMQEYDMDWMMPYDKETGEVWDTEVTITDFESDLAWLEKEAENVSRELDKNNLVAYT